MLKALRTKKGVANFLEYTMLIVLVLTMISVMSVYFRRSIQAKYRDGRLAVYNIVKSRVGNLYTGTNFSYEYEPYYTNVTTIVTRDIRQRAEEVGVVGKSTGIFQRRYNDVIRRESVSQVLPPIDAD